MGGPFNLHCNELLSEYLGFRSLVLSSSTDRHQMVVCPFGSSPSRGRSNVSAYLVQVLLLASLSLSFGLVQLSAVSHCPGSCWGEGTLLRGSQYNHVSVRCTWSMTGKKSLKVPVPLCLPVPSVSNLVSSDIGSTKSENSAKVPVPLCFVYFGVLYSAFVACPGKKLTNVPLLLCTVCQTDPCLQCRNTSGQDNLEKSGCLR
ncbi:hypothetical protein VTO42DRAFT_2380 [Malbranchea cinnamomea]